MASIRKHGKGYQIIVSCGYDTDGTKVLKTMSWAPEPGMSPKQAQKELDRQAVLFEEKVKHGQFIAANIKFADFAEQWMKDYAEKHLAPATVASYRRYLERTDTAIGHIRLDRLQPHHLIEFYDNLAEDGMREDAKYSPAIDLQAAIKNKGTSQKALSREAHVAEQTIHRACAGENINGKSAAALCTALGLSRSEAFAVSEKKALSGNTALHYHHLISSILSTAVQWQIIAANPAERVKPPRAEQKEAVYLDDSQARRLIELLDSQPVQYRVMVTLLLYSGLRRGELCGLEWKDIDFDKGIIHVCRASQYLPKKGIFTKDPKNSSSERVLQLSEAAFTLLRAYKAWQTGERLKVGDQWNDTDRLFTKWNGLPLHPDTLTNWFHDFIQTTDLPQIHIHSLRHTNATLLIAEGVNLRLVADMLGHSKPTTTLNIYSHAIKSAQAAAAERMGDILNVKKAHGTEKA